MYYNIILFYGLEVEKGNNYHCEYISNIYSHSQKLYV